MVIVPMLLVFAGSADQAFARNAAFMSKVQSMSVQVEATSNERQGVGKAFLLIKKPNNIAFDLKWGDEDVSVRASAKTILEVERNSRLYSEHEPIGVLGLPPMNLSRGVRLSLPTALLRKDVKSMMPQGGTVKYLGSEKTGSVASDHIRAHSKLQMGEITVDVWIDGQGALRQYDIQVIQPMSRFVNSIKLSNYKVNPTTNPGQFTMALPLGYVPFVFDTEPLVISQGQKLKISNLVGLDGKPFDLVKWLVGKKTLMVVAGKECLPSQNLISNIAEVSGGVRTVAILQTGGKKTGAALTLLDLKGDALKSTSTPSTPLVILLDSKGVVGQVWIGFDKANIQQLAYEIRTVSAQLK